MVDAATTTVAPGAESSPYNSEEFLRLAEKTIAAHVAHRGKKGIVVHLHIAFERQQSAFQHECLRKIFVAWRPKKVDLVAAGLNDDVTRLVEE